MPDGMPILLCICVPARNEAARLPALLDALAEQDWPGKISVAIAVNNTTDDSLSRIEAARQRYARRLAIHVVTAEFPSELAHAGSARRLAMSEGLRRLSDLDDAVLISTDADARPPADWLKNIAAAFERGADLVGGRIVIDEEREPLPAAVAKVRRGWDRYWSHVRAIEDAIDPVPWDPSPRHGDHTGASLAMKARTYRACGGVPLVATGEDRGLVLAALALGARLVHPRDVFIRVSPRTDGRAEGGMASAMAQLFSSAEGAPAPMAPAFHHWEARAAWRKALRSRIGGSAKIARDEPGLPPMPYDMCLEVVE